MRDVRQHDVFVPVVLRPAVKRPVLSANGIWFACDEANDVAVVVHMSADISESVRRNRKWPRRICGKRSGPKIGLAPVRWLPAGERLGRAGLPREAARRIRPDQLDGAHRSSMEPARPGDRPLEAKAVQLV